MRVADEEERNFGLERMVFFSDAVIAIAITVLVLEIKVPPRPPDLTAAGSFGHLIGVWYGFLYYALSFVVVGQYWLAHHRMGRYIKRYDTTLLWRNLFFLLTVAFIPIPTSLLREYGDLPAGTVIYAASLAITGLAQASFWWYASSGHRLVMRTLDPAYARWTLGRALGTSAVFLLSIPIAFFSPDLGKICWVLTLPVTMITGRALRRFEPQGA